VARAHHHGTKAKVAAAEASFKTAVRLEASNTVAQCHAGHKEYNILKADVMSNVKTRKAVAASADVVKCYMHHLTDGTAAKRCGTQALRKNRSRWNIHAPAMKGCVSKSTLIHQYGPLSWKATYSNCSGHRKSVKEKKGKAAAKAAEKTKKAAEKAAKKSKKKPRTCTPAEVKGKEFYSWEARGRHCYHIIAGKVLEQDYKSKRASKCNKAGFRKTVTIGRGQGISKNYPNGDSTGCPGRRKRSASLTIKRVPGIKKETASVSEPRTCHYSITITTPHCTKRI